MCGNGVYDAINSEGWDDGNYVSEDGWKCNILLTFWLIILASVSN